ncbi:MAG: CBS domain-containing protein [Candidatus Bathyarchaeota archaeon]|nr:CBS domain-containing protein [Candidatus Bathyarchaeota archaeon]
MAKTIDELSQTEISELINRRASVFTPEDSASKVKGELEKTGRYEAIVVGGGKVGMVTIRDLLGVDLLEQTKVDRLWKSQWQTPVTSDSWVGGVATELVRINARALPVVEDMRPVGIISQVDIVAAMADCPELKKTPAKDLAKMPLVTLGAYAKVAEARKLMLEKGISHIPIVKDEKLVGIVTAQDIVQYFTTGIGRMKTGDRLGPKASKYPGEVEDIMDKHPLTVGSDATALDVAKGLRDQEKSAALIVDEKGGVYGIITPKELLQLIAEPENEPELPISIVGLTNEEFLEKSLAEEKVKKAVSLGMKLHPDINNVQVVIKKTEKGGEKGRYEMTVRVLTPREQFQTSNEGYDLVKTFDGLVAALEKVLKHAKHEPMKVPRRGHGRP